MSALFACAKCMGRFPFEQLSKGQHLCRSCCNPMVKCNYCRSEFQQQNKGTSNICKKCEQNLKNYGKPQACEYCNVLAAFIGTKCQRCTHSQKKYGPPVTCEQCRQKCAFVRKDEGHKVDGKLLCWLCTSAYKRALAKAKQNSARKSHSSLTSHKTEPPAKKSRLESSSQAKTTNGSSPLNLFPQPDSPPPPTRPQLEHFRESSGLPDPDHIVVVTQLREQIASLQKLISQKEQQLLAKDRQISEIRADHASLEKELRTKLQAYQRESSEQNQELQRKIRALNKQVVTLTKSSKKVAVDSPS